MTKTVLFNLILSGSCILLVTGCFFEGTEYAPKYSEEKFQEIRIGDSSNRVATLIGQPLQIDRVDYSEVWIYMPPGVTNVLPKIRGIFVKEGTIHIPDLVVSFDSQGQVKSSYENGRPGIATFKDKDDALRRFGSPTEIRTNQDVVILKYTKSKSAESFHVRAVFLDRNGSVVEKRSFYHRD